MFQRYNQLLEYESMLTFQAIDCVQFAYCLLVYLMFTIGFCSTIKTVGTPVVPPPFTIIVHVWHLLRRLVERLRRRRKKSTSERSDESASFAISAQSGQSAICLKQINFQKWKCRLKVSQKCYEFYAAQCKLSELKHLYDFEEDCLDDLSRRKFSAITAKASCERWVRGRNRVCVDMLKYRYGCLALPGWRRAFMK